MSMLISDFIFVLVVHPLHENALVSVSMTEDAMNDPHYFNIFVYFELGFVLYSYRLI